MMMHASTEAEVSQLLLLPPSPSAAAVEPTKSLSHRLNNHHYNDTKIVKINRYATAEQRRRKATYDAVQQSVQEIMSQQQQQQQPKQSNRIPKNNSRQRAKRIVQNGLRSARDMIQKVNIGRWIDDLEHDQEIANELDRINQDRMEEEERKQLVAHVHTLCMKAIQDHLHSFQHEHPNGTYEEWIAELHPENVMMSVPKQYSQHHSTRNHTDDESTKKNDSNSNDDTMPDTTNPSSLLQIDPRFYVADSDHLLLWHEMQQQKQQHNK